MFCVGEDGSGFPSLEFDPLATAAPEDMQKMGWFPGGSLRAVLVARELVARTAKVSIGATAK